MRPSRTRILHVLSAAAAVWYLGSPAQGQAPPPSETPLRRLAPDVVITASDCTSAKAGTSIVPSAIGAPVGSVTLSAPVWVEAAGAAPAHCRVNGSMAPVDTSSTAKPINFSVALPASWAHRAAQIGGGGMNGFVPNLVGGGPAGPSLVARGFATYGSDSGHQASFGPGRGGRGPAGSESGGGRLGAERRGDRQPRSHADEEDARRGDGDHRARLRRAAALQLLHRHLAGRPRGADGRATLSRRLRRRRRERADRRLLDADAGARADSHPREAAGQLGDAGQGQRDPRASSCGSATRSTGSPTASSTTTWPAAPSSTSRRARPNRQPWAAKRCPNNVDPNPADTSAGACLTDGQISTLEFTYSRYRFATPLAHGTRSFGMWVPNTDPSGSGLILNSRFKGQEGRPTTRRGTRTWACRRRRVPDEGSVRQSAGLCGRRAAQPSPRSVVGDPRRDEPGPRRRFRSEAAR